jgi:hypothetical protein
MNFESVIEERGNSPYNDARDVTKKFYRNFVEAELVLLDSLQDIMENCYMQIPPYILKRMVERGILPDELELLDETGFIEKENLYLLNESKEYHAVENAILNGIAFEFSNEGVKNPHSPYRVVWAIENEGFSYFVKTAVPPLEGVVRVVDVWRKKGFIPFYPLMHQADLFKRGEEWDIKAILSDLVAKAQEGFDNAH